MTKIRLHRIVEAILFSSPEPIKISDIKKKVSEDVNIKDILLELREFYSDRGFILKETNSMWGFETAIDLANYMEDIKNIKKKLSKAGMETLAIIAYHQPITRPEIEEIRGVTVHSGTLEILFNAGWIEPKGKRDTPGRPSLWRTTNDFLNYFDIRSIGDLPSIKELKDSGLLSKENNLIDYLSSKNKENK